MGNRIEMSPKLLRPILLALLAFIAAGPVLAQSKSQPLDPVRLQLKWYPQFQAAGFYAAQAKGFYTDEGLDVTLVEGGVANPPIDQVLSGKADFGVSDADVLLRYLKGDPLVAVAAFFQHSPYILMTRQDSGIRSPSDLRRSPSGAREPRARSRGGRGSRPLGACIRNARFPGSARPATSR
jgi:ABC-type nitrate/sulfonate/bicarbonate transport system substrate-binding protein